MDQRRQGQFRQVKESKRNHWEDQVESKGGRQELPRDARAEARDLEGED